MEKFVLYAIDGANLLCFGFDRCGNRVDVPKMIGVFDTQEEAQEFAERYKSEKDNSFIYEIKKKQIEYKDLAIGKLSNKQLKKMNRTRVIPGNVYKSVNFHSDRDDIKVGSYIFVKKCTDEFAFTSVGYDLYSADLEDKNEFEYIGNIFRDKKLAELFVGCED